MVSEVALLGWLMCLRRIKVLPHRSSLGVRHGFPDLFLHLLGCYSNV